MDLQGLGIVFDPPASLQPTSSSNAAANPAVTRLQGQAALGKKAVLAPSVILARRTASANDADNVARRQQHGYQGDIEEPDSHVNDQNQKDYHLSGQQSSAIAARRKVRIVSAANTYHEQHYLPSGENSPAPSDFEYAHCGPATSIYRGFGEYTDQDDILDDYASSPDEAYHRFEEQDSIVYPSLTDPSPAPTMQTTLSARSLGAVSSGSSTRYNDALTMAYPQHATHHGSTDKVEEFEAKIRNLSIQDDFPGYGRYHRPATFYHQQSYTVDEAVPVAAVVPTVRGNLPVSTSTSSLVKAPALRRVGAMSRPKSMMELNQLYTTGANVDISELRQSFSRNQWAEHQSHNHPSHHASRSMEHQLSVQTTASSSAGIYSETSPASVFTEEGYTSSAPSSVFGHASAEVKPNAVFMGRQASSLIQQRLASASPHTHSARTSSVHSSAFVQPGGQANQPQIRKTHSAVSMRSGATMHGVEEAKTGRAAVVLDSLDKDSVQGVPFVPRHVGHLASPNIVFGSDELVQGGLLMAQPVASLDDSSRRGRGRAASVITTKTASSSGHSRAASASLASLPSTQGLPTLTGAAQNLHRQSTLLSAGGNSLKRGKELDRLLNPKPVQVRSQYSPTAEPYHSTDIPSRATFATDSTGDVDDHSRGTSFRPQGVGMSSHLQLKRKPSTVVLEQSAKGKARVEMDLTLASTLVVEGGTLKGRMEIRVRKEKAGEGEVWLGAVKARIVGFEELASEDARHVFYHHSVNIDRIPTFDGADCVPLPCYASQADIEGYSKGKTGIHAFPFEMQVPVGKGAKGSWRGKAGVVKYIVIGSIKLKSHVGLDRSIAHFYRHIDVFPYLDPSIILAPALQPLQAETSKALFMGGNGKVYLKASLHRSTWVAGQRCYANLHVRNEASKKIKTLTLSLIRTTTIFRPKTQPALRNGFDEKHPVHADIDPDGCATQTTRKKVAETSLDMGKKNAKGQVTAKGIWMGVDVNQESDFCHFLELPSDAISIERGRYLEISHMLKVSVSGSLSSEVSVEIPCRIVNFVSIDPPPSHPGSSPPSESASRKPVSRACSQDNLRPDRLDEQSSSTTPHSAHQLPRSSVSRMTSMDSLNMQDLNKMYNAQHNMSRQPSYGSQPPEWQTSTQGIPMTRSFTMPSGLGIIEENASEADCMTVPQAEAPGADPIIRRQLRHQMSLDCIGSAIASATARRAGHQPTNSALSSGYTAVEQENAPILPYVQLYQDNGPQAIQLDDLDDMTDEYESLPVPQASYLHARHQIYETEIGGTPHSYSEHIQLHDRDYAEYEDESEDEVDLVLQAKQYESDGEMPSQAHLRAPLSPSSGYTRRDNTASSPVKSAMKSAPHKSPSASRRSQLCSISKEDAAPSLLGPASALGTSAKMAFGVASPASPVKKSYSPLASSPRRNARTLAAQNSVTASSQSPAPLVSSTSTRAFTSSAAARPTRPAPHAETVLRHPALGTANAFTGRQNVERVPGPLSTPSFVRTQPIKNGMRKMASTSALRNSGM